MSQISLLGGLASGLHLLSGYTALSASKYMKEQYESQARLKIAETEREIANYKTEVDAFKESQKSAYIKSGVNVEGTVLDVLDETIRISEEKISATRAAAAAQARDLRSRGSQARVSGRMAVLSSLASAAAIADKYFPSTKVKVTALANQENKRPTNLSLFSLPTFRSYPDLNLTGDAETFKGVGGW